MGAFSRASDAGGGAGCPTSTRCRTVADVGPAAGSDALRTGEAHLRDDRNYFGPSVIRCARSALPVTAGRSLCRTRRRRWSRASFQPGRARGSRASGSRISADQSVCGNSTTPISSGTSQRCARSPPIRHNLPDADDPAGGSRRRDCRGVAVVRLRAAGHAHRRRWRRQGSGALRRGRLVEPIRAECGWSIWPAPGGAEASRTRSTRAAGCCRGAHWTPARSSRSISPMRDRRC